MTNESLQGVDALKQLPVTDVLLPYDTALDKLTQRTRKEYAINASTILKILNPEHPVYEELKAELQNKILDTSRIPPGGFSFTPEELHYLYDEMRQLSFSEVTTYFASQVFPRFFGDGHGRNPANRCLGYLLDLICITDPDMADSDQVVQVMAQSLRASPITPMLVGSMVDDAVNLRGTGKIPFELLMSKDEVINFQTLYLKHAMMIEKDEFQRGIQFKPIDVFNQTDGFSQN